MVYKLAKMTIVPLSFLYTKKINGLENIPKKGGFIIAANHASYADHLIMSSIIARYFDRRVYYLAKKEHFKGLQKLFNAYYANAIPLDRDRKDKKALGIAVKYLKEGKIIGIYPEGTRTLTGKLQRAKTGAVRLALEAHVPILPMGFIGTFEMLPKGKTIPKFKRATVNIGKPWNLDKHYGKRTTKKVLRSLTTSLMRKIAKLCSQRYDFD